MPKPTKLAITSSADIYWMGDLPEEFRFRVDEILSTRLSDAAWLGLRQCVRAYAILLNHEYAAAPASEQADVMLKVTRLAHELLDAIAAADAQQFGYVVSSQVADAWSEDYDEAALFDQNREIMVQDLTQVMSEEDARSLMGGWLTAGRLVRPSPVPDFVLGLEHFASACRYVTKLLQSGRGPSAKTGDAFQGFIGQLYEWKRTFRISAGVSRNTASDGGALTQLVKAIIEQVPEVRDNEGNRERKQMRRAPVADTSLAQAIENARDASEGARPS